MKQELLDLIEEKAPGSLPLLLVVRGSHAYGTNIPTSDTDYAGVFVQDMDSILGMSYKEQVNDSTNDVVIYEIKRFLELIESNNPTVLELLNTPQDCIVYKHPLFDEVLLHKKDFITKKCFNSFGGYAKQQIYKAKGQNKKQNWEKKRMVRKTPLDFCYVIGGNDEKNGTYPLKKWLSDRNVDQKDCGLVNISNARDVYVLYTQLSEQDGMRGIIQDNSNDLRLSSIPKGVLPDAFISYNRDGYVKHCKDYKSYQVWLDERNEARWVDVKSHGQKIDGKNMMHCRRLMDMAMEISEGKGIIVRRENAKELIDIRKGKVDLQTLIDDVERDIKAMGDRFKNSDLPDSVDRSLVENLLVKIRREIIN